MKTFPRGGSALEAEITPLAPLQQNDYDVQPRRIDIPGAPGAKHNCHTKKGFLLKAVLRRLTRLAP